MNITVIRARMSAKAQLNCWFDSCPLRDKIFNPKKKESIARRHKTKSKQLGTATGKGKAPKLFLLQSPPAYVIPQSPCEKLLARKVGTLKESVRRYPPTPSSRENHHDGCVQETRDVAKIQRITHSTTTSLSDEAVPPTRPRRQELGGKKCAR